MLEPIHRVWLETTRKVDLEIADRFGLESRNGRIVFPYLDVDGNVVKTKLLHPRPPEGTPKWTAVKDGKLCLFNEPVVCDPEGSPEGLVITEGELDCLTAVMAGHPHAVSLQNGAITTIDQEGMKQFTQIAECLAKWKWFILALDNDEKGTECREVLLGYLGKGRCKLVDYPDGCKDLNDVLQKHGIERVQSVLKTAKPYPLSGVFTLDSYPEMPHLVYHKNQIPGFSEAFSPFRGGLVVVAGIAMHGKSTAVNALLGDWIFDHKLKVCMASLEMPVKPFLRDSFRRYWNGRTGNVRTMKAMHDKGLSVAKVKISDEACELADRWIEKNFVFLDLTATDDGDLPSLDWLLNSADDAMTRHGFDVLVIDPWNKIDLGDGNNEFRLEKKALNRIKSFARQRNIIVIVVTHPSLSVRERDGKIRAPSMLDISGGAHWANMADHILVVHREDVTSPRVVLHVKKVKYFGSGKVGEYPVLYQRGIEYFLPAPDEEVPETMNPDGTHDLIADQPTTH